MATNKRITNLTDYKSVLPYASEILGVYQPLIGWKGKRNINRFILKPILSRIKIENPKELIVDPSIDTQSIRFNEYLKINHDPRAGHLPDDLLFYEYLKIHGGKSTPENENLFLTILKESIDEEADISQYINEDHFNKVLEKVSDVLYNDYKEKFVLSNEDSGEVLDKVNVKFMEQANMASVISRKLLDLNSNKQMEMVKNIIFNGVRNFMPKPFIENPFESFDPTNQLKQVGLSPVGVVHLFRQYFYELDSFLGTPVGHVWLSPGSQVELIESSTRRTLTERTSEYTYESSQKAETSLTEKDELSEAIKSENENSIKFGANVTAEQKWVWGEASQSASFDLETTQKTAREVSHTKMREQSTKLSSEIRKNYKTTFKTVTETTDVSSKRMVLSNSTLDLINYELRRKMRQVAVQVQDIGTYLCWQTFVDRPGSNLGLSTLVHIAEKPDGQAPQPAETIPEMLPISNQETITIECIGLNDEFDDNALDEFYVICQEHNGGHLKEDNGHEYIIRRFHHKILKPKSPGYKLVDVKFTGNADVSLTSKVTNAGAGEFTITLNSINFRDKTSIALNAESFWEVDTEGDYYKELEKKKIEQQVLYDNAKKKEFEAQYFKAARDRIKLASNIQPRKYEELREEERIVVYRALIKELGNEVVYKTKIESTDGSIKISKKQAADSDFHVFYELLNSIFDIDKMLYFVAPEWWKAKPISHLNMGSESIDPNDPDSVNQHSETVIPKSNMVTWGETRKNNYLITDESSPAKLGSSLGWLLQLDGDNLRNAFLNSPWVKAVMPIRPGKEKEALNWLKHVEGMNGISENDMYQGPEPEHQGKTLLEVLETLAEKVKEKHKASIDTKTFPEDDENLIDSIDEETQQVIDDRNIVSATPVDRVYEHGFYPLQEGFRVNVDKDFQIFDQWIEVLPTDQVVPVEVKYDPKTGRQI